MRLAPSSVMKLLRRTVPGPDVALSRNETITHWNHAARLALLGWTLGVPLIAACTATYWAMTDQESPVFVGAIFPFVMNQFITALTYAFLASQNPRLRAKSAWMLSFILAGPASTVLYWAIHVWPAPRFPRRVSGQYRAD